MVFGSLGANATAPIAKVSHASLRGSQLVPASRVSQTPPLPAPASQWLSSLGSTAIEAMRPSFSGPPRLDHVCALPCASRRTNIRKRSVWRIELGLSMLNRNNQRPRRVRIDGRRRRDNGTIIELHLDGDRIVAFR